MTAKNAMGLKNMNRKLSMSVQLSKALLSNYEGGDLKFNLRNFRFSFTKAYYNKSNFE